MLVMPGRLMVRRRVMSSAAPLPLDGLSNLHSGYGLRKLLTSYAGSAIRIREDGGDTELDIGFDGNDFDEAAFTAHVGANSGFIAKWYDQTGNGRDFSQSTAANQPGFTLNSQNGHPVLTFVVGKNINRTPTGDAIIDSVLHVLNIVADITAAGSDRWYTEGLASNSAVNNWYRARTGGVLNKFIRIASGVLLHGDTSELITGTMRALSIVDAAGTITSRVNGTADATTLSYTPAPQTWDIAQLGDNAVMRVAEMIVFEAAHSNEILSPLENEQMNYWGV